MSFKKIEFIGSLISPTICSMALVLPLLLIGTLLYTSSKQCNNKTIVDCLDDCDCNWCDSSSLSNGYCVSNSNKCVANITHPYNSCTSETTRLRDAGFAVLMTALSVFGFSTIVGIFAASLYFIITCKKYDTITPTVEPDSL